MPMDRIAVLAAIQTAKHSHNNDNNNNNNNNNGNANSTSEVGGGGYALQPYNTSNGGSGRNGKFEPDLNGNVNVLLGGAMMSCVIIVVVLICYCCHRNVRKNRPQEYALYWRPETDIHSLDVFTTHSMCHGGQLQQQQQQQLIASGLNINEEETGIPTHCPSSLGPPPTYDSLIFNPHSIASPSEKKSPDALKSPDETVDVPKETTKSDSREVQPAKSEPSAAVKGDNSEDLPTYEVALKLEADGYV